MPVPLCSRGPPRGHEYGAGLVQYEPVVFYLQFDLGVRVSGSCSSDPTNTSSSSDSWLTRPGQVQGRRYQPVSQYMHPGTFSPSRRRVVIFEPGGQSVRRPRLFRREAELLYDMAAPLKITAPCRAREDIT